MTEQKVFLHVGFSKTATTSLQNHVFAALPGFQCLGKPWRDRGHENQDLQKALSHISYEDSVGYDIDFVRNELTRVVDISGGDIIISHEGLTYGRFGGHTYYNPVLTARRLKDVFGEKAKIIFTIREQTSWLCSLYLDDLSRSPFFDPGTTIGRWFGAEERKKRKRRRNALDMANFDALIREYETVFGFGNIHVLVYEELLKDTGSLARNLCDALEFSDMNWMRSRLATMGSYNRRLSKRAYYFSLANRFVVPELFRELYHFLNPGLERILRGGAPCDITIPERCRVFLDGRYVAGNHRLNDDYDLDLAQYGYML